MRTFNKCLFAAVLLTAALAAPSAAATILPVACSADALIAAIETANSNGAATTVTLAAGCTYSLPAVDNETLGPNGLPAITGTMTIAGNGAIIQRSSGPATPSFRLFFVDTTGRLTLQDLTVRNGELPAGATGQGSDPVLCRGGAGSHGGGIFTRGSLSLVNSTLTENRAGNGGAGANQCYPGGCEEASYCYGGTAGAGGGIYNQGILTVTNSTVSDNVSGTGGSGGQGYGGGRGGNAGAGGGIWNGGTILLVNSTITRNKAGQGGFGTHDAGAGGIGGAGGGIANKGSVAMVNSTIHANSAGKAGYGDCDDGGRGGTGGSGGGIANRGSLKVWSSTITYNAVGADPRDFDGCSGDAGIGGGIFNTGGTVTLANSIVDGQRTGEDCAGSPPTSRRFSIGGPSCGGDVLGATITAGAARLAPLSDYGGPTETRTLLPGSIAINSGDPAGCRDAEGRRLKTDQRGFRRPKGDRCDIGAVELQPSEKPPDAIQCGSVLGPRGYYALDRDLTCPANPEAPSEAVLTVLTGATLDLGGHAVTCRDSRSRGIQVNADGAKVMNGTVKGCETGVGIAGSHNLAQSLVLIDYSFAGLRVEGGAKNKVLESRASGGSYGFLITDAFRTTLTGNTATNNEIGFDLSWNRGTQVLTDNEASGNGSGVLVWGGGGIRMIGNRIVENAQDGIYVDGEEVTLSGNTVNNNGGNGLFVEHCTSMSVAGNVVKANGGDGLTVWVGNSICSPAELRGNRVKHNKGNGIHVFFTGVSGEPLTVTITENVVLGHQVDLADDTEDCWGGIWRGNIFKTASQTCIH